MSLNLFFNELALYEIPCVSSAYMAPSSGTYLIPVSNVRKCRTGILGGFLTSESVKPPEGEPVSALGCTWLMAQKRLSEC